MSVYLTTFFRAYGPSPKIIWVERLPYNIILLTSILVKIAIFVILANIDPIFRGEGVEISKI